jgi:hypothetical protein
VLWERRCRGVWQYALAGPAKDICHRKTDGASPAPTFDGTLVIPSEAEGPSPAHR